MQLGTKERAAFAAAEKAIESGLCAGTTIMTMKGEVPVEHLQVGDRVITRDAGMSVVTAITSKTTKIKPIRIKAGSLGHTRPDRDMIVAPGTQLHIRDWRAEALFGAPTATVEAHRLLDGEFLAQQDAQEAVVFDVKFDRQHIIYADGIEVVSS